MINQNEKKCPAYGQCLHLTEDKSYIRCHWIDDTLANFEIQIQSDFENFEQNRSRF